MTVSSRSSRVALCAAAMTVTAASSAVQPAGAGPYPFPDRTTGQAIAIDSHGRTVVGAIGERCQDTGCGRARILVARIRPNGKLDRTFGDRGVKAVFTIGSGQGVFAGMAIDGSGRIVAAARTTEGFITSEPPRTTVIRLRPNGSLDTTFGHFGAVEISTDVIMPGGGQALTVDEAGRVLLAGSARGDDGTDLAVMRLLTDGSADPSFGNAGVAHLAAGPDSVGEVGSAVAITEAGAIVVGGTSQGGGHGMQPIVARFAESGTPDPSFGGGDAMISFSWFPGSYVDLGSLGKLLVDGQGRIVAVGSASAPLEACERPSSARLTPSGELDPTYSHDGVAPAKVPQCVSPTDGLLDHRGRLTFPASSDRIILLARQRSNGTADARFGDDGLVEARVDKEEQSGVSAVTQTPGGGLLATGYADFRKCHRGAGPYPSRNDPCTALLLAKFSGHGELDRSFGEQGFATFQPTKRDRSRK